MTQAGELLTALRRQGVVLEAPAGGGLHYRAPAGVMTPELRRRVLELKVELRDLVAMETEMLRLHGAIQAAWGCRARADEMGNQLEVSLQEDKISRLQRTYCQAMERYWALAGDRWEDLLNGIAAAIAPQQELVGVR